MKSRIKEELKGTSLANKIDSSDIGTFDSFAYNFVKQNANLINLDSNLELLDPEIFNLKKEELLRKMIISIMKNESNPFYSFIVDYTSKRDDIDLINDLKTLYEKLINIKPLDEFSIDELILDIKLFDFDKDLKEIASISSDFYSDNRENFFIFTNAK